MAKNNLFNNPDNVEVLSDDGKSKTLNNIPWWDSDKDVAYQRIIATVSSIENNQHYSQNTLQLFEQMYGDNRAGIGRASYINRFQGAAINNAPRLSLNVIQACIDALASMISSNKPKPQFVPNEGDWKQYSKAKMATDYLEGIFDACKVYPLAQRMFTDSCIYGISGLYVNSKFGKINVEYLMRDEIIVDELDGHNEKPAQLYLKRFYSRSKLMAEYPKSAEMIEQIPIVTSDDHAMMNSTVSDMIVIVECWHLPASDKSKDGMYAVVCEKATLKLESYDHMEFPVVFFRPYHKPHYFWGRGIAETLFTLQMSINKMLRTIQQSTELVSVPRVLVENGSQVNSDHINDRIGQIIEFTGTPPQFITPEPMPQSAYQWVQYLEEKAYQISGVSQAAASGEKPKGVESAVAMETVADIQAGRFENMSIDWNEFFMNLARATMFVSQDLYESNPKLATQLKRDNLVRNIKWADMNFDEDKFSIQLFPINRLPHDPAGRLDAIQRLIQAGWIDEIHGLSLLDMPDLSEETSMMTGSLHLANDMISRMLDDGDEEVQPLEQMDLGLAMNQAKLAIVNATLKKYPEENIALVVKFYSDCQDLQNFITLQQQTQAQAQAQQAQQQASAQNSQAQAAQATAQQQGAPNSGPPLANPQPTPTSPMLPNAPPPPQGQPS